MKVDLHTHSVFSDGTYTPTEIVDTAIASGLSAIALTDHNTVNGLPEFIFAAKNKTIEAIAGTELSVDYNDKELHLLGLFIDEKHFRQISSLMEDYLHRKEESNIQLIEALRKVGIVLNYEEIKKNTPDGKVNRAHIASAMMKCGYVESVAAAFDGFLSKSSKLYKEPKKITVWEAIDHIRSIDAIPILAHPFLNLSEDELEYFLPNAKKHGLVGMECYYSLYDEKTAVASLKMADKFSLLPSGGSDFHGERKPDIKIGTGKGELNIPYERYQHLKDAKAMLSR